MKYRVTLYFDSSVEEVVYSTLQEAEEACAQAEHGEIEEIA